MLILMTLFAISKNCRKRLNLEYIRLHFEFNTVIFNSQSKRLVV